MTSWRQAALVLALASGLLTGTKCGDKPEPASFPPAEVERWSSIPREDLDALWERADRDAGAVAVEPYTLVVGGRAAKKKTWAVADDALKFFVYGYQPIWFPADVVRRTVCGADPRWSYFWHPFSGQESDLHPWFDGREAFPELLGGHSAALGSRAVDLSKCKEVYADELEGDCFYGEVTPTEGFDKWFCGSRGPVCTARVNANHQTVPAALAGGGKLCVNGPFVLERVHGWRPEIHPAEIVWTREEGGGGTWTVALVPDSSGRFDQDEHFEESSTTVPDPWRPWSFERPVELWVAFSGEPSQARRLDLAMRVLGDDLAPPQQVTLTPPEPGAPFTVLEHELEGVLAASKVWKHGDEERGLLVLRTTIRKTRKEALVLRLRVRGFDVVLPPLEIDGIDAAPALVPERAKTAQVRLYGVARQQGAAIGSVAINTLVRFDPSRPAEPVDEAATDTLNEALKGSDEDRAGAFGKERPFRVEWDLTAVDGGGGRVPIQVGGAARFAASPPTDRVGVSPFPGPATEEIIIKVEGRVLELAGETKPISLGQLVLWVPNGVTVTGKGSVYYFGTKSLGLPAPAVQATFRYPAWSYDDEWALIAEVLAEVHPATASQRLDELKSDACAPAPVTECTGTPLAAQVAERLADPVERWGALRELEEGGRPFARFVWLFARGLRWDDRVTNDERELLKKLLS